MMRLYSQILYVMIDFIYLNIIKYYLLYIIEELDLSL